MDTESNLFFWIFMLVFNLLIPLTMIGFGYYFLRKVPDEINDVFGYRTSMSMKNQDTWKFAHNYAGKLWYYMGISLLPITILAMAVVFGKDTDTIGNYSVVLLFLQLIPLCGVIFPTEWKLRKTFDKDGLLR